MKKGKRYLSNPSGNIHTNDIMGVHRQPCPDCGNLLIYSSEKMRTDYREDGTETGTTLVVTYKKCQCQKEL